MARQIINVGATANDGTGDGLRTAYIKCNDNFQELYNTTLTPTEIPNGTSNVAVLQDANVTIAINGTNNVVVFGQNISTFDANIVATGDITGAGNITGNDFYVGDILTVTGTVGSNLTPDGNGTRSLGTTSSRWSDLFLSGSTLTLGGIVFKDNGSNVLGIFGSDGTTPATISSDTIDTSIISNGTSNIQLVGSDGNAAISVAGTSNVVVVSDDTLEVTGNIDSGNVNVTSAVNADSIIVTGNVDAGNVNVQDIVAAGYLLGDGGLISNVTAVSNVAVSQIANGSSIISFAGAGGNINLVSGGVQTGTITSTGANITGYLNATGNANVGNLGTAEITATGSVAATSNVSGGNLNTGGEVVATGNITGSNLILSGSITGATTIDASGNITTTGSASVTANIDGGNIQSFGVFDATGNISGGNILTNGVVQAIGNITGDYILGNGSQLTGIDATSIQNGTSNVVVLSSGGNVETNISGTARLLVNTGGANITGNANVSSAMTATGNVTGGNLITGGRVVATGNVNGSSIIATGLASVTGNISGGNISTGGVISATGNISGGNLNVISGTSNSALVVTQTATISTLANITASTAATSTTSGSLRTAGGAGVAGNIYIGGLASVTGAISSGSTVTATGNITGGNIITGAQMVATGNITGGNLIAAGIASVSSIRKTGSNSVGNIGQTDNRFNTVFATATSAQYADLAERYSADADYAPGTVLIFGGSAEVTASIRDADPTVAGVVSTSPAYSMNDGLEAKHTVAVALVGRVPTRVKGPIRRGQMLVSTADGSARADSSPAMGTVIGKALEDFNGDDGVIEVVIGRL